jgi:hypothetical protein
MARPGVSERTIVAPWRSRDGHAYGVPNVVAHERLSVDGGGCGPAAFGFQVGQRLGLLGFLQGHRFEMEVRSRRIETVDQLGARGDLPGGQRRQRMVCDRFRPGRGRRP